MAGNIMAILIGELLTSPPWQSMWLLIEGKGSSTVFKHAHLCTLASSPGVREYERESELFPGAPVAQAIREVDKCKDQEAVLSDPTQ